MCAGVAKTGAAVQHQPMPRNTHQFCPTASRHVPQQQMYSQGAPLCHTFRKKGLAAALCMDQI